MRRTLAILAMVGALVGSSAGCGGPDYGEAFVRSFHEAKRAYAAGRYAEAAALYGRAAQDAKRVKDRDEAHFMQARMYEKLERWPQAEERYRTILETSPRGTRAGRAAFELATLEIEHGDEARGWAAMAEAIERFPNHGSARRALTLWSKHIADTEGEEGLRKRLTAWLTKLAGTALHQQLRYERAHSHWRSGALDAAHRDFLEAARRHPYPQGTLTDDAYWHASHVAEEKGDLRLAIADLRELLDSREEASGGSYERPRYPEAQMRIGELYRDGLGDHQAAKAAFRRVHAHHETSILADDALWSEAVLHLRDGDEESACDLGEDLLEREPPSRYRRCLRQICPGLPAGERPCPDYILRTLSPEGTASKGGASG